jgi:PIN domain-containing protein
MDTLIFIDTNILLDFYRYPQGSAVLSILAHIDGNHDKIITGNQVEMEFKKNRQKVILESIGSLKGPKWETFKIPVIMSEAQPAQIITRSRVQIEKQSQKLQKRIETVLRDPAQHDVVYQTSQRLFRNSSSLNLTRDNRTRFSIRRLAWKRFILGYPPRKADDTSIGDSINWEWVIYCAKKENKNAVIVSRDSDYGSKHGNEPIINDWLLQEFRDRVSRKKKIILTNRLTQGFELAKVSVKPKEAADENRLITELSDSVPINKVVSEDWQKALAELDSHFDLQVFQKTVDNLRMQVSEYLTRAGPEKDKKKE